MPENLLKIPQGESPVARAGAGDISERELSRERHNLQTTPPARVMPAHPKKQLFSAPVNKFTGVLSGTPGPNLARLKSCLADYQTRTTPAKPAKIGPKALSMEDLTPNKRMKKERFGSELPTLRSPGPHSAAEADAAARVARFMLLAAWRRRRHETRCLRKTLECQVSCSERLRIQVSTLKALLDSDNSKVRLAMRELQRLKQLLTDKELERGVLEREKYALEKDVCAAEDRASEMSIGWRNCRNELEGVRAAAAVGQHALALERAAANDARAQRDDAYDRLSELEEELAQAEELLGEARAEAAARGGEADRRAAALIEAQAHLAEEREAHKKCQEQYSTVCARYDAAREEIATLKESARALHAAALAQAAALARAQEQLDWWPRPLTKMLGAARSWLRGPKAFPEAVVWTLVPARHGC